MTFSPDPEIRLRQKYESNRPFEDSLFVEVDKVQADGFHPESGSARARVGLTTNKHSEYAIHADRLMMFLFWVYLPVGFLMAAMEKLIELAEAGK